MPGIIDADTHIVEPREMWDFFDKELHARRPVIVTAPDDTLYKPRNLFWMIDGNIYPKGAGKGGANVATPVPDATRKRDPQTGSRELTDIPYRVNDMNALGVQTQIVYPTLFLIYLTDDPVLDVALAQAYNRFVADACAKSEGRIRWVAIPPLRSIEGTLTELDWAKQHGAVGVFFRGLEGDLSLDDPYFFPVYEKAAQLDLPICIHTGAGSPSMTAMFDVTRSRTFPHVRMLPLMAFRNLVANGIPQQFPGLRFGFIETGASWVPYAVKALLRGPNKGREFDSFGPAAFKEMRLFVSYETDEDLPYLLEWIGEDNLIVGTDYGHTDQSAQIEMIQDLRAREELPTGLIDKMLTDNPAKFYGLLA